MTSTFIRNNHCSGWVSSLTTRFNLQECRIDTPNRHTPDPSPTSLIQEKSAYILRGVSLSLWCDEDLLGEIPQPVIHLLFSGFSESIILQTGSFPNAALLMTLETPSPSKAPSTHWINLKCSSEGNGPLSFVPRLSSHSQDQLSAVWPSSQFSCPSPHLQLLSPTYPSQQLLL